MTGVGAGAPRTVKTRSGARVYTAQTLADFCEVDLKTVHHWADRGKVPHFRTEGRHLRFRRNDVVRFLRAHNYPLPDALVRARPSVALALGQTSLEGAALTLDEVTKRLGSRFAVRRHASGAIALAHLLLDGPDALVFAYDDATLGLPAAIAALKADPALAWIVVAVITPLAEGVQGADVSIAPRDAAKLSGELARILAVA